MYRCECIGVSVLSSIVIMFDEPERLGLSLLCPIAPDRSETLTRSPDLGRILLIEDNDDLKIIIPIGLELMAGVRVIVAQPQQDWLSIVQRQAPAIIFIDTAEAGVDMLQTMPATIRDQQIPIICTVDRARTQDRQIMKQLGATVVISRPFDMVALGRMISQLIMAPASPSFIA